MKDFIVAIDLHGTLLDENWKISEFAKDNLVRLLKEMQEKADFYICTGNDYSFIKEYIPRDLFNTINGFVCESGCVTIQNNKKTILTDEKLMQKSFELAVYLKKKNYPFLKYFGNRETTVTLFTKDEKGGESPENYYDILNADLQNYEFKDDFYIAWSNVAFDIIPTGFSKWNSLQKIAENKTIVSFMDSYNDKEIAMFSDYTIMPLNVSDKLIEYLRENGSLIFPLDKFHIYKHSNFISKKTYTDAVIEGLKYIKPLIM
jgi:hydroxymethylpyrimidine pyrophosphatase-like HAD family hydrolase